MEAAGYGLCTGISFRGDAFTFEEAAMAKKKSKSMTGSDGGRKLASGAGRTKAKSGGEPQKPRDPDPHPDERPGRTGSSKQRKG